MDLSTYLGKLRFMLTLGVGVVLSNVSNFFLLEGLLQKTCIPKTELAHFLSEMRKTPSGPVITSKLLAGKIQAGSEIQALRAIDVSFQVRFRGVIKSD